MAGGKRRTPAPRGGRGPGDAQLGGSEHLEHRLAEGAGQIAEVVDLAQRRAAQSTRSPFYYQSIVFSAFTSALGEIDPDDRASACAAFIRASFESISDAAGPEVAANIALAIATRLAEIADGGPGRGAA